MSWGHSAPTLESHVFTRWQGRCLSGCGSFLWRGGVSSKGTQRGTVMTVWVEPHGDAAARFIGLFLPVSLTIVNDKIRNVQGRKMQFRQNVIKSRVSSGNVLAAVADVVTVDDVVVAVVRGWWALCEKKSKVEWLEQTFGARSTYIFKS